MSEVRWKCDFCKYVDRNLNWAPCVTCVNDKLRHSWEPSAAGQIALRLEAEVARLTEDRAATQADARRWRVVAGMWRYMPGGVRIAYSDEHESFACVGYLETETGTSAEAVIDAIEAKSPREVTP